MTTVVKPVLPILMRVLARVERRARTAARRRAGKCHGKFYPLSSQLINARRCYISGAVATELLAEIIGNQE